MYERPACLMVQVTSGSRPAVGDTAFSDTGSAEPVSVEARSLTSAPDAPPPAASGQSGVATSGAALIGQTLGGRYLVTALIGSGGMGAVYRAEHVQLQKPVALKVLNSEMALHKEAAARFEREEIGRAHV